uniref:Ras-GEF domain-containing protein n=1 Tax=Arcella intermedia TaxID=1963864 RepID=A0A6B2L6F3_9EUKA
MDNLVTRLVSHRIVDPEYSEAFFLSYRIFTTPLQFLEALKIRFFNPKRTTVFEDQQEAKISIQIRIVQVMKEWLNNRACATDFEDRALLSAISEFLSVLDQEPHTKSILPDLIAIMENRIKTQFQVKPNVVVTPDSEMISPLEQLKSIQQIDAKDFAQYLSFDEFKYFQQVPPREFLQQCWLKPNKNLLAPNLLSMTKRFCDISEWVVYEVLLGNTPKERAGIVTFFLQVARELLELQNLSGMAAIMGGLTNASVSRLKKTFQKLHPKYVSLYQQYETDVVGMNNWKNFRAISLNADPPFIPLLAITLKDLTYIEEGNPDFLQGGGINFYKLKRVSLVISDIMSSQSVPYPSPDPMLVKKLDQYLSKNKQKANSLGNNGLFKISKKFE